MSPPRVVLRASLVLLACGAVQSAQAGWPNDAGVNVRLTSIGGNQFIFHSVADGAGGVFYVWSESNDVRAQHLTDMGLPAAGWPAAGMTLCASPYAQYPSGVAADGAGGLIVAWDDYRNGAGSSDVYVQRVTGTGQVLWTANGVQVCGAAGAQYNARVCSDRAGGALLVWTDDRDEITNSDDLYAQRVSATGVPMWAADGTPVCTLAGIQDSQGIVSDGTVGGAFIAWRDYRTPDGDVYALRLYPDGYVRPGWAASGSALCNLAGDQSEIALAYDGNFGAFATWSDSRSGSPDIYLGHMDANGPAAAGWPANGIALTSDAAYQSQPAVTGDGAGGAIVAWADYRAGNYDVYAQRVGASAGIAWTASGVSVVTAPGDQNTARLVPDGAGGAMIGWLDYRAGVPPMVFAQHLTSAGATASGFTSSGTPVATAHWVQELVACTDGAGGAYFGWQNNSVVPQAGYAQHVDRWGFLGAQATIESVKDVPNDQGGRVKLSWDASPLDAYPGNTVALYRVYRSVPAFAPQSSLAPASARLTTTLAGATYYWEQLTTVAAAQLAGYSVLAATAQDSVTASNPRTLFMVRAEDATGARFWNSDPDSGYSADNLAPAAPAPFTGAYVAGTTRLHWSPNAEADFATYRLYRGTSAGFVPAPGNEIAAQPDTGYTDAGPAGAYYKLVAVDSHDNASAPSLLSPASTTDVVPGPGSRTLAFAPAMPNPSRGSTQCRFSLPSAGPARVTIHDAAGRLVRVLAEGTFAAGEHAVRWDGTRDGGGRAASGLYLARLSFGGRTMTRKLVRVD